MNDVVHAGGADKKAADGANLVYILYLAALLLGITGLIGVIIAYLNRKDAPDWVKTHYTYQIHTFWKGMLYMLVGLITTVILIGVFITLFALVWYIVRCVKGMKLLAKGEAVPEPKTWMW